MTLAHEISFPGAAADFAATLRSALPRLETERLVLRAPVLEDFQAYAEIFDGPAGRFLTDSPDREGAWYDFTQMVALWLLRGFGLWSVEWRNTGELIGFVLLGFEPGDHEPELGYLFRDAAQGQGFATEAAQAARTYAFETAGLNNLVSTIDFDNLPSQRLAERLGATRDVAAEAAHNSEILVYRHPKEESPR